MRDLFSRVLQAAGFLLPVLLFGCSLFSSTDVVVSLPELPSQWNPVTTDLGLIVVYPEESEPIDRFTEHQFDGWKRTVTLRLPKRNNTPVLVYPVLRGVRLKPAGGILPYDVVDRNILLLSWEQGFIAELYRELYNTTDSIHVINTGRLTEEIARAAFDPWSLDRERIAEGLRYAQFSSHLISTKETLDITLNARPGQWICDNPFAQPVDVGGDSVFSLEGAYGGLHRFFKADDEGRIDLFIDTKEYFVISLFPEGIEYGTW